MGLSTVAAHKIMSPYRIIKVMGEYLTDSP